MVRVISVHHFSKQHIQTVEQPTATTIAPPDRLLLALSNHCIEVRDLSSDADLLFSFPTVDEVKQIVHCVNGDYIATLERKRSRQNSDTFYARIYANWDSVGTMQQSKMTNSGISLGVSECGMVQPMRARIAGRVTPTTNQSEVCSLEMIELPVKRRPDLINCCQVSGSVLILSAKYLMVYKFCVRTHDISKLRFIDFEELSLLLELSFKPSYISICENYIACMSDTCFHFFTVSQTPHENLTDAKKNEPDDFSFYSKNDDAPLNYKQMLKDEEMYNYNLVTVNLPSIIKENSAIHKHCPFTCCDTDMTVNIKSSSPIENWAQSYQIDNLLQLKLKPMVIEGAHRQISEEFKCIVLKPLYVSNSHKPKKIDSSRKPLLKSEYGHCLNSVACMLTTQQEGYLYIFSDNSDPMSHVDNCIAVYPFTAPIYKIVLEDYILHALTETGLESYTLRIGHQLTRNVHKVNNINVACPSVKESVCLVGLRPFIGVEQLLMSDHYLILLANSENSPTRSVSSSNSSSATWTLYNLELPSPLVLYNDFLSLANIHQFSSPQTYCHLISEAHMVLKITLMLLKWKNKCENAVNLIVPLKNDNEELSETYKDSCKLLGDYYVMCDEEYNYTLSLPYYKMSQITPLEVLKRVQEIQNISNNSSMIGLLYYLKTVLLQIKTWTEADVLFTLLGEQNFVDTVLDLFSKYDPDNLSTLVLKNNVLREYATDKLITIFLQKNSKNHNDLVALAVLYLQRYMQKEATNIFESIPTQSLYDILVTNWELLFETTTSNKAKDSTASFSELTAILIGSKPQILAELLAYLVTDLRAVSFEKLLRVFLDFLPSHISKEGVNGSLVLQILLEKFFKNYYSLPENVYRKTNYDGPTFEALKILVRTYLSQLQIWQMNTKDLKPSKTKVDVDSYLANLSSDFSNEGPKSLDADDNSEKTGEDDTDDCDKIITNSSCNGQQTEDFLFSKIRWPYLDLMPPFYEDELYKMLMGNHQEIKNNPDAEIVLKKLQALLCSQLVPKQVINEMLSFFKMNVDFKGNVSLQSIVLPVKEGIAYLLEKCPYCTLQYGKDRFTKDEEWTILITSVQRKICFLNKTQENKNICTFYVLLLKDIMMYLATNLPLQRFIPLLPPSTKNKSSESSGNKKSSTNVDGEESTDSVDSKNDLSDDINADTNQKIDDNVCPFEIDDYEPYVLICKQTAHANHIKRLIITTGQKLLTTQNL